MSAAAPSPSPFSEALRAPELAPAMSRFAAERDMTVMAAVGNVANAYGRNRPMPPILPLAEQGIAAPAKPAAQAPDSSDPLALARAAAHQHAVPARDTLGRLYNA